MFTSLALNVFELFKLDLDFKNFYHRSVLCVNYFDFALCYYSSLRIINLDPG